MKLGIMQPYLFPYIGYFQLINAVDVFVIHDDVQYIKGGWINRNRILLNEEPKLIGLPLRNGSSELLINQREFTSEFPQQKSKVLRQIEGAYRKAPSFVDVIEMIGKCFQYEDVNVANFVCHTIKVCCQYLGIGTPFQISSALSKDPQLRGQERVICLNQILGSDQYINPIGGVELYSKPAFAEAGIVLSFLKNRAPDYQQLGSGEFVPNLSIIDVLMNNPVDVVRGFLAQYELG